MKWNDRFATYFLACSHLHTCAAHLSIVFGIGKGKSVVLIQTMDALDSYQASNIKMAPELFFVLTRDWYEGSVPDVELPPNHVRILLHSHV